ncbi:MAG: aspartate aminotransferase family protein [Bacteroidetes bacterium]|nr:MAG: aspartate aminotransferase family protein [Bacteroidota bacterium]
MENGFDNRHAFTEHLAWTSDSPLGLEVVGASGSFLELADGSSLIDLISGIAVSSLGHRHPAVLDAITSQLDRHLHVMVYGELIQSAQVRLAERLASLLPDELSVCYFTMTGTEANEGALKLARKKTGRTRFVAFERSYHGDTMGSLSVTGHSVYRDPYEPLIPGVIFLPYDDIDALSVIDSEVAAVITEPIQGEGGIRVPDPQWLKALRSRCSESGALLIFDEIQTGFGRTGDLFAFQNSGVVPDIMTVAKAMGGGMPIGAFISSPAIMSTLRTDPPLSHVTTFGGHPVSAAAADAALQVLLDENLIARAQEIESRVRSALEPCAGVVEIRGRGAMLGMVLQNASKTERAVRQCLDGGVLLGWTLHSDTLVRIAPPLNIPWSVLDQALETIREAVEQLSEPVNRP